MKLLLKNITFRHYLNHVRRQSRHVQHLHAIFFAGVITSLITAVLLYTDYGFWHEIYRAEDVVVTEEAHATIESPAESLGTLWRETKSRFGGIGSASVELLEGKETYQKSSE